MHIRTHVLAGVLAAVALAGGAAGAAAARASFDGIIDGGTAAFADAHGTFHARTLPDGDLQITASIGRHALLAAAWLEGTGTPLYVIFVLALVHLSPDLPKITREGETSL